MENTGEEEDYWNVSKNKAFSFDDDATDLGIPAVSGGKIFIDDNISEISYDLSHNEMPLNLIISEKDLLFLLEEQSIEETPLPKNISLEEEVKLLRRTVQEKYYPPPCSITINKILLGKRCTLEAYKSLNEKEELLDEAINSGNGNAILYVTLFIARTLNKTNFYSILQTRPDSIQHYVNYLTTRLKLTECNDLLLSLGKIQELSILQYQAVMDTSSNAELKKQKLKQIYSDYFSQPGVNNCYTQIVTNYINLLEWQLLERKSGASNSENICDKSVLESLYYACRKHKWGDTNNNNNTNVDSPQNLCTLYKISPIQFEWIALNERASTQAWKDIEGLFEKKTWHNIKSKNFTIHIHLDKTILQLYNLNAPVAILNYFLSHVDDSNRRLALARKVNANRSIVDAFVLLKDRIELQMFSEKLEQGTEEKFYAENALKNMFQMEARWYKIDKKLIPIDHSRTK